MKWLNAFLQGKWLGHPLHPALVHVPTGLWPAALAFDLLYRAGDGDGDFARAAFYCIAVGLAGAVLAVPPGNADWLEIKPEKPARRIGLYHLALNVTAAIIWSLNLAVRWRDPDTVPTSGLLLSAVGVAILLVSGYLGGRMVYDYGIGIARQSKKKWRMIAQTGGANLPEEK